MLEKTNAAEDGTDRHVELALRSGWLNLYATSRGVKQAFAADPKRAGHKQT